MAGNDAVYASFVSFVVSTVELLSAKVQCRLCSLLCVRRILPMQKTARAAADLPMAKFSFAVGKQKICRLSGKKFAVGQRDTCRWQTFTLPTANKKFAVGKCAAGHRQNSTANLLVCALAYTKTGDAAGMAAAGIRPFVYSPAEFAGTADLEEAAAEISALQGRTPRQLAAEALL